MNNQAVNVDNPTLEILRKVANTHNEYFLYRAETGKYEVRSILENCPTFVRARELGRLKYVGSFTSLTEKRDKLNQDSDLLVCYVKDGKIRIEFLSAMYERYKVRNNVIELYYGNYDEIEQFLKTNNLKIN